MGQSLSHVISSGSLNSRLDFYIFIEKNNRMHFIVVSVEVYWYDAAHGMLGQVRNEF